MKNVIKWIILIAAIAAVAGLLAWLIASEMQDNGQGDVQDKESGFTVSFGGNSYSPDDGEIGAVLPSDGQVRFDVTGTESYTVKVLSSITDRDGAVLLNYYIIDGGNYLFSADDYTDEFISEDDLHDDHFVIECTPGRYDLKTLLCRKWNAADVAFVRPVTDKYPYRMVITSADGEEIVVLLVQE